MVKLTLLDGSLELREEQKQILLKTPYFEALFVRWSESEQTEYEVGLTVNTVKFLLGEVTQLNVLTQAAKQAVEEARRELDMVGAMLNQIDLESPIYPVGLHPLLEPYVIKQNSALTLIPDIPTPEMYQLMFEWNTSPVRHQELNRLVGRVDPETFPAYLRLFWQKSPPDFLEQNFNAAVIQQILLHPEIFQEYPKILQTKLTERLMNIGSDSPLCSFYRTVLKLDMTEWIEQALNDRPSHDMMMKIVRQDSSYLFLCLKLSAQNNSHSWGQFQQLLGIFDGVKEYPLTEEQTSQLSATSRQLVQEWSEKQIYVSRGAEIYKSRFETNFDDFRFDYCDRLLALFPSYPFSVWITSERKLRIAMNWFKVHPQLLFTVANDIYSNHVFPVEELEFLLPHTHVPYFGIDRTAHSDHALRLLHKYNAHTHPDNVFIGSPKIAIQMFQLTRDSGLTPSLEYLPYFIRQKMWDLLPLLEPLYKKDPNRRDILHDVLRHQAPAIVKIFLIWETSLC